MKLKTYRWCNKRMSNNFNLTALRKKPKAMLGAGIGNQSSGKGDTSIKRVNRSYTTYEKLTTDKQYRSIMDQQQAHFQQTEGNRGYASLIRAPGQLRLSDITPGEGGVRRNAYGVGGGAVGKAYGGNYTELDRDALQNNTIRESLIGQTEGRRGNQKQKVRSAQVNQQAVIDGSIFAPARVAQRGDTLATGTVMRQDDILHVSARPTETYTQLGQHSTNSSFGIDTKSNINEKYISVYGNSGKDTQHRFEKYQPDMVGGVIERILIEGNSGSKFLPKYESEHFTKALESKIKVEAQAGKKFLPKYEKEHFSRELQSKIMARDVTASSSTSRNNAKVEAEHFIKLTPNKPTVAFQSNKPIPKNTDPHRDDYKIRHSKPNLSNFSAGAKPTIPIF